MPRERTTWNHDEIAKKASLNKKADPYTMNQDHVKQQPSADKYVIGDPSDFAEDVHPSKGTWEAEYANGQVKRNEIGMPEMRGDTFNHAEKTATQVEAEIVKKAALAVNVAKAMLKSASDSAIEDQATRLMKLSDEDLVATYKALVAEEDEEDDDQEDKQAGELPPWLKKDDDKGEEKKDEDKKAADQEQAQDKSEEKQAGEQPPWLKKDDDKKDEKKQDGQDQGKQAQLDQVAQLSQMVAQLQQQVAQLVQPQVVQAQDQAQQDKPEEKQAQNQEQAQQDKPEEKQAQMNQQAQAQMIQQAVQQAMDNGQDPVQAAQQAIQGCMTQQPMADDGLIDEMLQQQQEPMMMAGEMGIELEAATMDTGELSVTADDAILAQLFASQESQDAEQAQGGQQKQAAVRTASTRTVGTRPTQGVSQLGGFPSASKGGDNKLENIWASAPDVSGVFGTR